MKQQDVSTGYQQKVRYSPQHRKPLEGGRNSYFICFNTVAGIPNTQYLLFHLCITQVYRLTQSLGLWGNSLILKLCKVYFLVKFSALHWSTERSPAPKRLREVLPSCAYHPIPLDCVASQFAFAQEKHISSMYCPLARISYISPT